MTEGKKKGRPRSALDTIIAAVAEANGSVVVTENEKDFVGVEVFNPLRTQSREATTETGTWRMLPVSPQKLTTIEAPSTWLLFLKLPVLTFSNTARLARSSRYSALKVVLRLNR